MMTPQLQQAIKLLQLSRLELEQTINQELLENPLLEQEEPDSEEADSLESGNEAAGESKDGSSSEQGDPQEVAVQEKVSDDFDWENYLGEYSSAPARDERAAYEVREAPAYENVLSKQPSLESHLLWQLKMADLDDKEMRIGAAIIGNINADGYLAASLAEVASLVYNEHPGTEPPQDFQPSPEDLTQIEKVIGVIQQFDPLGVAARDLRECLIVQATVLYPGHDLVHDILENHLPDLEARRYQAITKALKVSTEEVAEALEVIRSLEPKPGRMVSDEEPRYITPDVYVYKMDDEFVIVLNEDGLPKLRVNNIYKQALAKGGSPEAKEYVQSKLRSALWLIRSIHQRQRTLYKVTESIVKFQRNFFERGIAYLRPLVLRDVAEDVGMHESTISRVTTNKYMHTNQGVYELKFFFNSGINRVQGGAVASEAVKDRIKKLISAEDSRKPLSDQAIADLLKRENVNIARRTVAKYREMMSILPSSRRKKLL